MKPKSKMRELEAEYISYMEELGGDIEGRNMTQDYLESSTAVYEGHVIAMSAIPKLVDASALKFIDEIQKTTYAILEKVFDHYILDKDYADLFHFSPLLDELVRVDPGYPCAIPMGRFDIFFNEETFEFKFCEFNTDGTSAMNEEREAGNSLCRTPTFKKMSEHHKLQAQDLFDGWIDAFMEVYDTYKYKVQDPLIAIVDFRKSGNPTEFGIFQDYFKAKGHRCEIAWINELKLKDDGLYTKDDQKIDAIYRRAVTSEIMDALEGLRGEEEKKGAEALCEAYKKHQLCMQGGFRTNIAHCKQIFQVLQNPKTFEFLDEKEREFITEHIPFTAYLSPDQVDVDEILLNKDEWIIKPTDGCCSKGVFAGLEHSEEKWAELVNEHLNTEYVVQPYCKQYQTMNCLPRPIEHQLEPWNNLLGYFNYNGKFAGLYYRAGQNGLIVGYDGGITIGVFLTDVDLEELGIDIRTRIPISD